MQRFCSWNLPAYYLFNFVMPGPETTACMAVLAQAVRAVVPRTIPVGIQILGKQYTLQTVDSILSWFFYWFYMRLKALY
jgi:hypothetical protein